MSAVINTCGLALSFTMKPLMIVVEHVANRLKDVEIKKMRITVLRNLLSLKQYRIF